MGRDPVDEIPDLVAQLYTIVRRLEKLFPGRPFTVDGHLLGSIGEVLAAHRYGLKLRPPSTPGCDADTATNGRVEVKTTQGESVGFRCEPPALIVLKLAPDGSAAEIYNGPGSLVWQHAGKPGKNGQRTISLTKLRKLMAEIPEEQRIAQVTRP